MKKRLTAISLALCLVLSLAACSSGGGGGSSQTQEPPPAENTETPSQPDGNAGEEQPAEDPDGKETNASTEVNEYGITDEALQSLVEAIKENVTDDYLNVYSINPSDFSWPEADADFWSKTGGVITFAASVGQFYNLPDALFEKLSDEDAALAKALTAGIAEWEDDGDGRFFTICDTFSDENDLVQFFLNHVTFE